VQTARLGSACYRLFVIGHALADIRKQKIPAQGLEGRTITETAACVNHSICRKTEVNQYDIKILQVNNVQVGLKPLNSGVGTN